MVFGYMMGRKYLSGTIGAAYSLLGVFFFPETLKYPLAGITGILLSFILIFIYMLVFIFIIIFRYKKLIYDCRYFDHSVLPMVRQKIHHIATHLHVAAPNCIMVRENTIPFVVGLRRPTVVLPYALVQMLSEAELEAIIAHELFHIRRRDHLFRPLFLALLCLPYFQPLLQPWVSGYLRRAERACDQAAVQIIGDPLLYAETLYKVVAWFSQSRSLSSLQITFQLLPHPHELRTRIHDLLEPEAIPNSGEAPTTPCLGKIVIRILIEILEIAAIVEILQRLSF